MSRSEFIGLKISGPVVEQEFSSEVEMFCTAETCPDGGQNCKSPRRDSAFQA